MMEEINIIETERVEELLEEQLEILKEQYEENKLSPEEEKEIEQVKKEQEKKEEELEQLQKDFFEDNVSLQEKEIEKIDLLIEIMTDIQDDLADYNKNQIEGAWFISLSIVLALGLKFFMSEILKW